MLTFDIAAKIVTPNQKAYVVHAGEGRRNHKVFVEKGIAFLEIPDFRLDKTVLASPENLRRAVRRYFAERAYLTDPVSLQKPSSRLEDYSSDGLGKKGQLGGSISTLFSRMKPGDIVITPGFERIGNYRRQMLHFGEITSEFNEADIYSGERSNVQRVPFRRVNWVNSVQRNQVSPALETRIGRPPAVRGLFTTYSFGILV